MKMSRKRAVTTWVNFAMKDFLIAFVALEAWRNYQPFFLAQGVEKICKAYFIGRHYSSYKTLRFEEAKMAIDKVAKKAGHNLGKLLGQAQKNIPQINGLIRSNWDGFAGDKVIDALQAGYTEVRYPVPIPVSRKHPIKNARNMHWDPLGSSGLEKFSFAVSKVIINALEMEFRIKISQTNKYNAFLSEKDWNRFSNLFFRK